MRKLCTPFPHIGDAKELEVEDAMDVEDHGESVHEFLLERDPHGLSESHLRLTIMYLTYLQENFKPVAHRSASVEVFDEEDAQVVHRLTLPAAYGLRRFTATGGFSCSPRRSPLDHLQSGESFQCQKETYCLSVVCLSYRAEVAYFIE